MSIFENKSEQCSISVSLMFDADCSIVGLFVYDDGCDSCPICTTNLPFQIFLGGKNVWCTYNLHYRLLNY